MMYWIMVMTMSKEIFVYRVEYEKIPSMSSWTAFVAGHSPQEAENYIQNLVGPIRTITIGMHSRLDALTTEARERIVNAYLGKSTEIKKIELGDKKKIEKEIKKLKK